MNYRKFLIAALLVMSFAVQAKDITVTRLTCEMREGRVTTSDTPRLGWQMSSPENGTRQTAYEIEIRDVWAGKVVWNSGKVKSAQSQLVSCADAVLEKDRHYTWRVRVGIILGVSVFGMRLIRLRHGVPPLISVS